MFGKVLDTGLQIHSSTYPLCKDEGMSDNAANRVIHADNNGTVPWRFGKRLGMLIQSEAKQ
jgi:hypothetical protein